MMPTIEELRAKTRRANHLADAHWRRERATTCCVCGARDCVALRAECDLFGDAPVLLGGSATVSVAFCNECLIAALKESE